MNIMPVIKLLKTEMAKLRKKQADELCPPTLLSATERARREWLQALRELDHIDSDLSDYVIFKINAAERHYMTLLKQAKQEGVIAWPADPDKIAPASLDIHP